MATYKNISGTPPQYQIDGNTIAAGYFLKGYEEGTTTPLSMATDDTGGTLLAKCKLNTQGYPLSNPADDTTVFIPFFNEDYKLALYRNATDADNNTTANADWVVDNIPRFGTVLDIVYTAADINYNEGSTGALTRTIEERLQDNVFIKDFVLTADGLTDNSTDIQTAFNAVADGGTLNFDERDYIITTGITHSNKSITVNARGATFNIDANVTAFLFDGTILETKDLSGNYTKNGVTINVNTMDAAFVDGEPFKILSDAVDPANRDKGSNASQYRVAEWSVAKSATSTVITLDKPLRFPVGVDPTSTGGEEAAVDAYTTALNARVIRLSRKKIRWIGGTIAYEEGHDATPWTAAAFVVRGYENPYVEIDITRGYSLGVSFVGCYHAYIDNSKINNLTNNTSNGQFGYGVADASFGTRVGGGCSFTNNRHGYTTNALISAADETDVSRVLSSGRTVGFVVSGRGYGGSNAIFDTHHDAEDGTFENIFVEGVAGLGVNLRGRNISARGVKIRNCNDGLQVLTEFDSGDPDDDLFTAGKPEGYTTATLADLDIQVSGIPVIMSGIRRVQVDGYALLESSSHQMVTAGAGLILWNAATRFRVHDFDGASAITETTNVGVIDMDDPPASFVNPDETPHFVVGRGCDIFIDANDATDASSDINLIDVEANATFENRGTILAELSADFSTLYTGGGSFLASPSSLLEFALAGSAESAITTGVTAGNEYKFEGTDLSIIFDNTTPSETATGTITLVANIPLTDIDSSGGAVTATLGSSDHIGHIKTIVMSDATTSSTLSVTNHETSDPEVFTFADVDDTLVLMWTGTEWITIANSGVAV